MNRIIYFLVALLTLTGLSQAQITISSKPGNFDTLASGKIIYYQYAWDDPLDEEYPEVLKLNKPIKAFETVWDSMAVSDGSILLLSSTNVSAVLIVDATGWDLIDRGYEDTINYPNISSITVAPSGNEIEWMNFGFFNEIDLLFKAFSNGSVKISVDSLNSVHLIYGDIAIVNPDLCFEGFGSLRPSVTYVDSTGFSTWFIYGNPASPSLDTLSDTAFANLPLIGQTITLNFNKTNALRTLSKLPLKISPNPVEDQLTLLGSKDFSGAGWQIIAMDGKVMGKGRLTSNTLNIETIKPGSYILKIVKGNQIFAARFIKI